MSAANTLNLFPRTVTGFDLLAFGQLAAEAAQDAFVDLQCGEHCAHVVRHFGTLSNEAFLACEARTGLNLERWRP